jgi:hypothetical protein
VYAEVFALAKKVFAYTAYDDNAVHQALNERRELLRPEVQVFQTHGFETQIDFVVFDGFRLRVQMNTRKKLLPQLRIVADGLARIAGALQLTFELIERPTSHTVVYEVCLADVENFRTVRLTGKEASEAYELDRFIGRHIPR